MSNYVTHLECSISGGNYPAGQIHGLSEAGRPLLVRYDLERMRNEVSKQDISASSANGFWRYAPMLPVTKPESRISLGEVVTPLIPLTSSTAMLGGILRFQLTAMPARRWPPMRAKLA